MPGSPPNGCCSLHSRLLLPSHSLLPRALPSSSAVRLPPRQFHFPITSSFLPPSVRTLAFPCFIGGFLSCFALSTYSSALSFLGFCYRFGASLRSFPLLSCYASFRVASSLRIISLTYYRCVPQPSLLFWFVVFPSLPSPFGTVPPFGVLCGLFAVSSWIPLRITFCLLFFWVLRDLLSSSFRWT